VTRTPIRLSILFLPYAILVLAAFALGIALLFSSLAISFPDVIDMYQVALTAWMYLTPVIYPQEIIPSAYRVWMVSLNPMYYLVEIFRMPIYEGVLPPFHIVLIGTGIALFSLVAGWAIFTHNADQFNYRI